MSKVEPMEAGEYGMFAIKKGKGCFMSFLIGGCFVCAAVVSIITVGLCVYYLAPTSKSEAQQWTDCLSLAEQRGECVCPDGYSTTQAPPETPTTSPPTTTTRPTPPPLPTGLRLNRTFIPSHYQIELQPRMYTVEDDFGFNGSVTINMTCTEESNLIVLHIEQLTIHAESLSLQLLTSEGAASAPIIMKWEEDVERQFLKIWTTQPMPAKATYELSMTFNGTLLHPDFGGLYLSTYIEDDTLKYLATTQFQRTDARRAFPCFDEPSFKATYDVTLVRKNYASSISNMPLKSSTNRTDDWVADEYETSVVMSTYLLAFVISEFQYKEVTTDRGTYFRLWARPKFLDFLDYAVNVSGPIMEAYADYTGIPSPIPKTDQIAIPDFAAGAMENWGLITYRETALLVNANYTTMTDKRYVATVISHELAHFWFGNLVTCNWWDETWLNEGFANNNAEPLASKVETTWQLWFGNLVTCEWWGETWLNEGSASFFEDDRVDVLLPEWKMNEYYLRTVWSAMGLDDRVSSQPVYVAGLEHHSELGRAFSSITYRKGGSVIRMMKYFLGEDTFQKGIAKYLDKYQYSNTERWDLYKELEDQAYLDGKVTWDSSKANFSDIMETWIAQMGYPYVTVTDDKNGKLTIEQKHFLRDSTGTLPASPVSGSTEYRWQIPLTYMTEDEVKNGGSANSYWIYNDETVEITGLSTNGWKLVNIDEQGFYRVRYDQSTWDALLQQLKDDHTVIPVINRGQIVEDAFRFAEAGLLDELQALKATEYLSKETEYLPLYAGLATRLKVLENLLYHTTAQPEMNTYIANLVKNQYATVGWDNSDPSEHIEKYARIIILRENCDKRRKECLDEATKQYAEFMANKDVNPISPDFRSFVYCTAIAQGGVAEFEHAQAMFEKTYEVFIGYEKNSLLSGMSCVREPWLVKRYLEYALEANNTNMFTAIAGRREVQSQVWDFLMENADSLHSRVNVGSILNVLATYWSSTYDADKVNLLANKYINVTPVGALRQIEDNRKWLEANQKPIEDWLKSVNSGSAYSMESYRYYFPKGEQKFNRPKRDIVEPHVGEGYTTRIEAV